VAPSARASVPRAIGGGPVELVPEPPARDAFVAEVGGTARSMRHATARVRYGRLDVVLADAPFDCAHAPPPQATRIELTIPPGPGGAYFAGSTIGVPVHVVRPNDSIEVTPKDVRLRLDGFVARPGERIHGALVIHAGSERERVDVDGGLDATLCDVEVRGSIGPSAIVPEGLVHGRLGDETFQAESAIALLVRDERRGAGATDATGAADAADATELIAALVFFPERVDCSNWRARAKVTTTLSVYDLGRASASDAAIGAAQPVLPVLTIVRGKGTDARSFDRYFGGGEPFGQGWIRLDTLSFSPGGVVTGAFVAESDLDAPTATAGEIGGEFRALVCR
jgi:hypothetical protein